MEEIPPPQWPLSFEVYTHYRALIRSLLSKLNGFSVHSALAVLPRASVVYSLSLSLSLSLRFNGHFPGEPGLAGVY